MVFTPVQAVVGGLLIGGATSTNAVVNGRVTGISGYLHGIVTKCPDWRWRALFCVGLGTGGAVLAQVEPYKIPVYNNGNSSLARFSAAGLLVGLGSVLGNGCTSGHGICGLARFSPRSLAHVVTFMGFGAASAKLTGTVSALAPSEAKPEKPVWKAPALPEKRELGVMAASLAVGCACAALLVIGVRRPALVKAQSSELTNIVERNRVSSMVSHASAFVTGLVFSGGLVLAGMTDPVKVASFLDVGETHWDPSLACVMVGAIGAAIPGFQRLRAWKATGRGPLLPSETNRVPDPSWKVDPQLLTGAALFGTGWGLAGVCPGPAIVQVGANPTEVLPIVFAVSMLGGMRMAGPVAKVLKFKV